MDRDLPERLGDQLRYWFGGVSYTAEVGFVVGAYLICRVGGRYRISPLSDWSVSIVTLPTLDAAAAWLDLTS